MSNTKPAKRARYYVLGDQHESGTNAFYCACCDLFKSGDHFRDPCGSTNHQEKASICLSRWNALESSMPKYERPKRPPNIVTSTPEKTAEHEGAFYSWLMTQKARRDIIGDLAQDAAIDKAFPRQVSSLESIRAYLAIRSACVEALVAADEAWEQHLSNPKSARHIKLSQRFSIFKRDGYRCQICGASPSNGDGVRLEVDHKVPVARGGSGCNDNLWTLCFDCNRGKGVNDL